MTWESASTDPDGQYVWLIAIETPGEVARMHTGVGPIVWNGFEYVGLGDLGEVSAVSGGAELEASPVTVRISGIPSDRRAEVLNVPFRGCEVIILDGIIDRETGNWSGLPDLVFSGFVSRAPLRDEVTDAGPGVSITIECQSAAARARRGISSLQTDAAQRDLFPDDRAFEFVTDLKGQASPSGSGAFDALGRVGGSRRVSSDGVIF